MEPTYMKIAGATVVVTGGARRIGKHISLGLAQRGANVVVNYQSSATEAHEVVEACVNMGTGALAVQADISSKLGVEAVRDAAISKFGGVDCLINNASIYPNTPLDELTEDDFDRNIAVNLKGPYLGCWLFGLHMRERGHGKIVNITDWGVNRPYTNYAPYFVAKGGIVTLTKVFAKELAPTVMVNAIAPGPILMPDDFSTSTVAAVAQATPLRRIGDPEDLLQTTLYLLEGTDFVTGAVIPVDGGRTIS
ncbi:MAG: short-chain dehydrogenase [Chloroflexi bacterium]|nr:short-chain dehydrogenase [Chloroflexota bacterium]HCU72341.1 short-chain dehydrogenase [Chloroflexota bacterium]|tara:strand:- start:84 stop:833 length:750 start_codon:yes stop_codon:yes gene_type:complete